MQACALCIHVYDGMISVASTLCRWGCRWKCSLQLPGKWWDHFNCLCMLKWVAACFHEVNFQPGVKNAAFVIPQENVDLRLKHRQQLCGRSQSVLLCVITFLSLVCLSVCQVAAKKQLILHCGTRIKTFQSHLPHLIEEGAFCDSWNDSRWVQLAETVSVESSVSRVPLAQ